MIGGLLGEGSSDRALLPLLRWVVSQQATADTTLLWVDTSFFGGGRTLPQRVRAALTLRQYDLLFIHRDADNQQPEWRFGDPRGSGRPAARGPWYPGSDDRDVAPVE